MFAHFFVLSGHGAHPNLLLVYHKENFHEPASSDIPIQTNTLQRLGG